MAKRDSLINVRQRSYVARDFAGFRAMFLEYARAYYPDRIQDFSEASVGGLLMDFAAMVGDNLSFYQDYQFNELDADNAVESVNIERQLRAAGVEIVGAAPGVVDVAVYVQIPAAIVDGLVRPSPEALPVIQRGSVFSSDSGVDFILVEDIDMTKRGLDGELLAQYKPVSRDVNGVPTSYVVSMTGVCVSGQEATETFSVGSTFVPFREFVLSNPDISEITNVVDSYGNTYYQVSALTHDVVYRNVANVAADRDEVPNSLRVVPAPYRYMTKVSLSARRTTLVFGGGNADTLEDDIIPDPTDFAIPLPYTKTFSRISINPEKLLQTKTLGVAAVDTTVSVTYRHGGGLDHNVERDTIKNVRTLLVNFPGNPPNALATAIRGSLEVSNPDRAAGGDDAPDIDELKALIPSARNAQERMVSRPDLLARVYSLPTSFGRVYRAAVGSNPNNPLATQLFVLSRSADKKLVTAPDSLKKNIIKYLNPYRMISDAVDVLDARVINLQFMFDVIVDPNLNSSIVMQNVLGSLQGYFDIKNFHIDQPIILSEVLSAIQSAGGIVNVSNMKFVNISGAVNNREYSDVSFDIVSQTKNGVIFPPAGGIFEVRYPEVDVVGKVV